MLLAAFSLVYVALAWTEPTIAPPGGNPSAPLNPTATTQTKTGGLNVMGSVGIGTVSPIMPLEVNGAIKSKGYAINIAEFRAESSGFDYEFGAERHLVKIKTNFPYTNGSHMPALFIEGFDYGGGNTLGINLVWYVWNNQFNTVNASSYGSFTPKITLANEGGKVVILLERPVGQRWYYSRFTVSALSSVGDPNVLKGWTFAAEPITGTNATVVSYRNTFENGYFSGDVGIGTTAPGAKLEVNGGVRLKTSDVKPACDANTRGVIWFTRNDASGTTDKLEVCRQTTSGAGTASWTWKALF